MTEQLARQHYDQLCTEFRVLDRCLTKITVFGNYRWTPEMLKARQTLVAMLNKRLRELSATIADAFAVLLAAMEAEDAALEAEVITQIAA